MLVAPILLQTPLALKGARLVSCLFEYRIKLIYFSKQGLFESKKHGERRAPFSCAVALVASEVSVLQSHSLAASPSNKLTWRNPHWFVNDCNNSCLINKNTNATIENILDNLGKFNANVL